VSAYRDEMEKCPRCSADLIDAGSVRACTSCRGQWVPADVLVDMAVNMQSPLRPIQLSWVADKHETLGCPTCGKPMEQWKLYRVPIDRCRDHGIWFDRDELMQVLLGSLTFERQ
jgi:Zn-finger nucleic acid-binding protein